MFMSARFERPRANRRSCVRAALGPFPRSVWIHPHTPEDELDRVCFKIWRRSVWAKRSIWPHLAGNAHRFADDPLAEDFNYCLIQKHQLRDAFPAMVMKQSELAEVSLMVQREMTLTLQQEHDSITPFQMTTGECCSLGDDPHNPEEIISVEEAQRREIEKFLKEILITKQDSVNEVSEGLSLEDFPPLPCAASLQGDQPAEQAEKTQVRNEVSPDTPPLGFKSQRFDDLTPPKPQRTQRRRKRQRLEPVVFTKTARMEEIQATQASKSHNEPCSQLSCSCQSGDPTEALDGGQTSEKQGRSNLPMFDTFHFGGKPMIENFLITDRLQGKSADGAHVARDPAGTDTARARKAAGPPQNARNHLFQEDATVLERTTLSSANDKVGEPIGHMGRVQEQSSQYDMAEKEKSSRDFPQKASLPEYHGPATATGTPSSDCPGPQMPMRHPPGFTQPQLTPESIATACLLLSSGMLLSGCVGVPILPLAHVLQPFSMSGDTHQSHLLDFNSDNFPDNVNPQGANRQCSMCTPNGFTVADATRSGRHPF